MEHLEDSHESEFTGATLSISPDGNRYQPKPPTSASAMASTGSAEDRNANFKTTGVNNGAQIQSQLPQMQPEQPTNLTTEDGVRDYFVVREGAFEKAVESCRPIMLENLDGMYRGAWLLVEIDHWDTEKERLILLTDKSLLVVKYDFITLRILGYRRILLQEVDRIIKGDITYPEKSLIQPRNAKGIRLMWNKGQPLHFTQSWNPWSREIPYVTYTSHRLLARKANGEARYCDVDLFTQNMIQQVRTSNAGTDSNRCIIEDSPILIENYMGLVSILHNSNEFGYFKARGKVSF